MISIMRTALSRLLHNVLARLRLLLNDNRQRRAMRNYALVATIALIILTVLAVNARSWFTKAPNQKAQAKSMQVELFTLHRYGFEPPEITRPKGQFIIAVNNHSGIEEVTLQLHRVTEKDKLEKIAEKQVPSKQLYWMQQIDLLPGRYALVEASHEKWVSFITITPN